uniref:Uncharacterized protein n=1 Tax=Rhizophora mucronata TaxID=61149 RepID=A0A2P2MH38_RHIMU
MEDISCGGLQFFVCTVSYPSIQLFPSSLLVAVVIRPRLFYFLKNKKQMKSRVYFPLLKFGCLCLPLCLPSVLKRIPVL